MQYWNVDGVLVDPCAMDEEAARDPAHTVQDLVGALEKQEQTATTEPVPVAVDGHAGLYVELTAPADLSFADVWISATSPYWGAAPATRSTPSTVRARSIAPGSSTSPVTAWCVVAAAPPGVTAAQVARVRAMVESIRFVEPDE